MTTSVAELCIEHKIDLQELSRRSNLEAGRVTAIIMGRWTPSPAERKSIADVFDLTIDDVTWGHKTPIQHIYGHGPG